LSESDNGYGDTLYHTYKGVSKSFRTGRLERELQMIQLSATRCSCIAILWVSLMSFAHITLCVASQRVFVVIDDFGIDSVRTLLYTPSYVCQTIQSKTNSCTSMYIILLFWNHVQSWKIRTMLTSKEQLHSLQNLSCYKVPKTYRPLLRCIWVVTIR